MSVADELLAIYGRRGSEAYFGEAVTMLEHGLQAAYFARTRNASDTLVIAALLHDIGHLIEPVPDQLSDWTHDAGHERSGAHWLAAHFGPEVSEPVRLHVPAKRYLCATDPQYFRQLSAASVITLKLQGGPMSASEVAAFEAEPHWRDAIALRECDDQGKMSGFKAPDFESYRPLIDRLARTVRPVRAVLFDLDGTLINTEIHTDAAVSAVAAQYGIGEYSLPHTETHGRTWMHVADMMRAQTAIDAPAAELAAAMLAHWNAAVAEVHEVPGAAQAIHAAVASGLKIAVVSSSPRSVIDYFIDRLGIGRCVDLDARVGGDAVRVSKPDPEGFLLAARALGIEPADAVIFEDSRAGLLAARAAGMRSMFITCCAAELPENAMLATATCTDYRALPPGFWSDLAAGAMDLTGRSFP